MYLNVYGGVNDNKNEEMMCLYCNIPLKCLMPLCEVYVSARNEGTRRGSISETRVYDKKCLVDSIALQYRGIVE